MVFSDHRAEIDGLRAVAVIPVVLFHFGLGFSGGWVGVDVFFVISGFLITSLIIRGLEKSTFTLRDFWERRARRILPAALTVMIASLIAGWFLLSPHDFKALGESAASQTVFLSNFYFWNSSGYFSAPSELKPLLHTWSLAVEEQFYIFLPLLIIGLWKIGKKATLWILGAVFGISFILSVVGVKHFPDAAFYLLPMRAWELLAGSILAVAGGMSIGVRSRWLSEVLGWSGMLLILFPMFWYSPETRFPGIAALPPVLGTVFIILSAGKIKPAISRFLSDKRVVFIGWISYSLYLWHWPVVVFAKRLAAADDLSLTTRLILVVVSVVIAILSWQYIEKPFRTRKVLSDNPRFARACLGSLCAVLLLGLSISLTRGVPSRFSEELQQFAEGRNDVDPMRDETHNVGADSLQSEGVPLLTEGRGPGSGAELLVWGDSHGAAVMPAIREFCEANQIRAFAATQDSTIPLLDTYKNSQTEEYFERFNDRVFAFVRNKNVKHVLLVGKWSGCVSPEFASTRAVGRALLRSSRLDKGADQKPRHSREVFETAFQDTVDQLLEADCRVWLMEEVPRHESNVPNLLMDAFHTGDDLSEIGPTLKSHWKRTEQIREIFAERAAPGEVVCLDPTPLMQSEGNRCLALSGGKALYSDDNHLSVAGAMHLLPLFDPLIREICSSRKVVAGK